MEDKIRTRTAEEHRDEIVQIRIFDVEDNKGRTLGASARTGTETFEPVPEDYRGCYTTLKPGKHWFYRPHALRGGLRFGALQRTRYFDTPEARDADVARYFAGAEKRARKVAAKLAQG